jgi:adenine-specific DNA-methyltransferase
MSEIKNTPNMITSALQEFLDLYAPGEIDRKVAIDLLSEIVPRKFLQDGSERFGLEWRTKSDAHELLKRPVLGTVAPFSEEDINPKARHYAIQGDNLEVMKILEKAYFGKIKMIYMNPPFNIGGELIFDDSEGYFDRYEKYVSEKSSSLSEISLSAGTSHSNWLTAQYVRLILARNLLQPDGVIFVSIDDHEFHHLRMIMDEIFGEENFVASFVWEKRYSPPPDTKDVGYVHENILCYRRSEDFQAGLLPMTEAQSARYTNPDGDPKGPWKAADYTCRYTAKERPNLYYEIIQPKTGEKRFPKKTRVWACSESEHLKNIEEGRLWWGKDGTNPVPAKKKYLFEIRQGAMPKTILGHDEVGHTDEATKELREHVPGLKISAKPSRLFKHLLNISNATSNDVVLDCHAGTGAMFEAIVSQEAEDANLPHLISIEFPQWLPDFDGNLFDALFKRFQSCIKKYEKRTETVSFYRMRRSNFRQWAGTVDSKKDYEDQLELHIRNVLPESSSHEVLIELLLKAGFTLSTNVEVIRLCGKEIYSVEDGAVLICLEKEVTSELIDALADAEPLQVICLDEGFQGNDQLKANAVQTFKARAGSQESEIVFKTV